MHQQAILAQMANIGRSAKRWVPGSWIDLLSKTRAERRERRFISIPLYEVLSSVSIQGPFNG